MHSFQTVPVAADRLFFSFIVGIFISLTEMMGFIVPHCACFMYRVLVLQKIFWAFRQKNIINIEVYYS